MHLKNIISSLIICLFTTFFIQMGEIHKDISQSILFVRTLATLIQFFTFIDNKKIIRKFYHGLQTRVFFAFECVFDLMSVTSRCNTADFTGTTEVFALNGVHSKDEFLGDKTGDPDGEPYTGDGGGEG